MLELIILDADKFQNIFCLISCLNFKTWCVCVLHVEYNDISSTMSWGLKIARELKVVQLDCKKTKG